MGKRYHCGYCDRSFVDDIQARKKHLQGSAHIRSYKQHYEKQRDLVTLIAEEEKKEECYKFNNTGFCAFGESCYRSHFTRHQLNMFRHQLEEGKRYRTMNEINELKTLDSWLQRRNNCIVSFVDSSKNQSTSIISPYNMFQSSYYSYLPQSLQNVHISKPGDIDTAEWG